jgi:predicted nucleic acid-binding protein
VDAFDADVLIYAAEPGHELGSRVAALFTPSDFGDEAEIAGVGSVLLIPELLTKPVRTSSSAELESLKVFLGRLDLLPADIATARLAVHLGAAYGLRTADAIHLATAVGSGADRFITNNASDFGRHITEIDITYPNDLP